MRTVYVQVVPGSVYYPTKQEIAERDERLKTRSLAVLFPDTQFVFVSSDPVEDMPAAAL